MSPGIDASSSVPEIVLSYGITFLLDILMGVLLAGQAFLYMNIAYGQPAAVNNLFSGFSSHQDTAVLLRIPYVVTVILCQIPATIYRLVSGDAYQLQIALLILLAGDLLGVLITLPLSQVYYLFQDFPESSAMTLIKRSIRLMKGNVWRLIKLYLSFIPMMLLGMVTLFIPLFWVAAYLETSLAVFYQDLMTNAASKRGKNIDITISSPDAE